MALNYPDPLVTNPWYDGVQWWNHDGDGWLRIVEPLPDPVSIMTGFKNVLINGDFRVNQRSFDGNWVGTGNWVWGFDRWRNHSTASHILQTIEPENLIPNAEYTLSWKGGGNGSLQDDAGTELPDFLDAVSPITGNLPADLGNTIRARLPYAAYDIQLERGAVATDFEVRSIQQELNLCYRYFWRGLSLGNGEASWYTGTAISFGQGPKYVYPVPMRIIPAVSYYTNPTYESCTAGAIVIRINAAEQRINKTGAGLYRCYHGVINADAEL